MNPNARTAIQRQRNDLEQSLRVSQYEDLLFPAQRSRPLNMSFACVHRVVNEAERKKHLQCLYSPVVYGDGWKTWTRRRNEQSSARVQQNPLSLDVVRASRRVSALSQRVVRALL